MLVSCVLETLTRGTSIYPEVVSTSMEELGMVADMTERAMLETVPSPARNHGEEEGLGRNLGKERRITPRPN